MNRWAPIITAVALGAATASAEPASEAPAEPTPEAPAEPTPKAPAEPTPEGVTQIIPRGTLRSIDDPVFVSAADADLPDDAWILGVHLDGESRAYSLNLLNHHEVVNDVIGDVHFAAVW